MFQHKAHPLILFLGLILLTMLSLSGCQSTASPKDIRIGMTANHSPWEELSSEGSQSGISIDFIAAYEEAYQVKAEVIWLEQSELQPALDSGSVDCILSSIPASELLLSQYSLSDPYIKTFTVMLHTLNSAAVSKSTLNSEHIRIAVLEGSYEDSLARSQFSNAEIQIFKSRAAAVDSLLSSNSDVLMTDALSALHLYANHQTKLKLNPAPLSDQYQYYVVVAAKGNDALTTRWSELFAKLRKEGYYERLNDKYVAPLDAFIEKLNLQIAL